MLLYISLLFNLLAIIYIVKDLRFRFWLNGQLTTMSSDMKEHKREMGELDYDR